MVAYLDMDMHCGIAVRFLSRLFFHLLVCTHELFRICSEIPLEKTTDLTSKFCTSSKPYRFFFFSFFLLKKFITRVPKPRARDERK